MYNITFKSNVLAKIDGGEKRGKTRLFVEGQTIEVSEVYSVDEEIVFEVQVGSSAVTYYGVPLVLVDTNCEEVESKR